VKSGRRHSVYDAAGPRIERSIWRMAPRWYARWAMLEMAPFNSIGLYSRDLPSAASQARASVASAFRRVAHDSSVTFVRVQLAVQSAVAHGFASPPAHRFISD